MNEGRQAGREEKRNDVVNELEHKNISGNQKKKTDFM